MAISVCIRQRFFGGFQDSKLNLASSIVSPVPSILSHPCVHSVSFVLLSIVCLVLVAGSHFVGFPERPCCPKL